mgnify:CR=1 FL=1
MIDAFQIGKDNSKTATCSIGKCSWVKVAERRCGCMFVLKIGHILMESIYCPCIGPSDSNCGLRCDA